MARPKSPMSYRPRSYDVLHETIADAIETHLIKNNISAADISKYYPSARAGMIRSVKCGHGSLLGLKQLCAIAEASGLKIRLEVSA
ncbi:hypothetical protein ABE562_04955 [Brucella intermedia]|uniref:Uncharacterized protein n=2 Tax=Brucella intermedia TaxID=94625 RepID=A0AA42GV18_9HYPH|nr:hypothetical protein [Brucella intermedia]MDH0123315.1 hypothetical protein [Brucella intermedia GD04153]